MKKIQIYILAIVVALILIVVGAALMWGLNNDQVACSEEAKICADGSVVGRIAPDCEFAKCPNE